MITAVPSVTTVTPVPSVFKGTFRFRGAEGLGSVTPQNTLSLHVSYVSDTNNNKTNYLSLVPNRVGERKTSKTPFFVLKPLVMNILSVTFLGVTVDVTLRSTSGANQRGNGRFGTSSTTYMQLLVPPREGSLIRINKIQSGLARAY